MKKKQRKGNGFWRSLWEEISENRTTFFVFISLWLCTLAVLLQGVLTGRPDRAFTGVLCLLLFLLPPLVERSFSLQMPAALEICAYLFVFCAGVLGEIGDFYQRFPAWDAILHAANGFLFAGFGFCLFSLFEQKRRGCELPSPAYQSFTAFCFSMTVGTLWEIFEFGTDQLLQKDMQKDRFLQKLYSVSVPGSSGTFFAENITEVQIKVANGMSFTLPAYLDVGLFDTMGDMMINLVGALVFCVVGYVYLKRRRMRLAAQFIPRVREEKRKL